LTSAVEFVAVWWGELEGAVRPVLQLVPPNGGNSAAVDHTSNASTVHRHDLLGGLIHEYERAA